MLNGKIRRSYVLWQELRPPLIAIELAIALRAGVVTCYIFIQRCCICYITFVQSERSIFLHELLIVHC